MSTGELITSLFRDGAIKEIIDDNLVILDGDHGDSLSQDVEAFYQVAPFPSYDDNETPFTLATKADENIFAKRFKSELGYGKVFLEVGCGTGQLTNYLAHQTNNLVVGFDLTLDSLRLGSNFAKKAGIKNAVFVKGNLFDTGFRDETFDVVWCSGVLHHTANPLLGFEEIVKKVKKGGYVIIGLYNTFGRGRTFFRQWLYRTIGERSLSLDPALRKMTSEAKKTAWIRDQYIHPHESHHTFDEVLGWFDRAQIEYLNSFPKCDFNNSSTDPLSIFKKSGRGDRFSRICNQLGMLFSPLGGEGGLFLMIGRRHN